MDNPDNRDSNIVSDVPIIVLPLNVARNKLRVEPEPRGRGQRGLHRRGL